MPNSDAQLDAFSDDTRESSRSTRAISNVGFLPNENVDIRFTPDEVASGLTYTISDGNGGADTASVDMNWEEGSLNYDLFATISPDRTRIAHQEDGTALLQYETMLDGNPISTAAVNGDLELATSVNSTTIGVVDAEPYRFANPDVVVIYGDDLAAAGSDIITVGAIDAGTDALSNDVEGARIVGFNGLPIMTGSEYSPGTAFFGRWYRGSDGGAFRIFEHGVVQFRDFGTVANPDGSTGFSYTIAAPGATGETLTTTFTVDLVDRPSEIFSADDLYSVGSQAMEEADGTWVRLGALAASDGTAFNPGGGKALLENDFLVPEITQVNGSALQEGVFFDGSNGGQFRVFAGGVVDFVNRGPNKVGPSEITSFTYTGDQGNTATVSLRITDPDVPGHFGVFFSGAGFADNLGSSVSFAGDINGDGLDDFLIGARQAKAGGFERGETYLIFGTDEATGLPPNFDLSAFDGTNGMIIRGADNAQRSGGVVAAAGDVNGDGFDDFLIGASGRRNGEPLDFAGETYVVFGSGTDMPASLDLSSLDGTNGFLISGIERASENPLSASSAGDLNGDGYDDILIGSPEAELNGSASGQTFVVFGGPSVGTDSLSVQDIDGTNGFVINGVSAGDSSGASVASAGDFNGDGKVDILIGAPHAPNVDGIRSGEVYLIYGPQNGQPASLDISNLDGINGSVIGGAVGGGRAGRSVAAAGDVNNDGYDDILIGAPLAASSNGEAYLLYGSQAGLPQNFDLSDLDGTNGFTMTSANFDGLSGSSVSSAGDVNGDGYDDILIGAPNRSRSSQEQGLTYLVFGEASGIPASLNLSALDGSDGFVFKGPESFDLSGSSVSSAGDVNGDGYSDLLIGTANGFGSKGSNGQAYLVYGGSEILEAFDLADGTQDASIDLSHITDAFIF